MKYLLAMCVLGLFVSATSAADCIVLHNYKLHGEDTIHDVATGTSQKPVAEKQPLLMLAFLWGLQ